MAAAASEAAPDCEWVVNAHVGDKTIRVLCGRGSAPVGRSVAWLAQVALSRWHPNLPKGPHELVEKLRGDEHHIDHLASVLALCKGSKRLGPPVRVSRLGKERLIRGKWSAEEIPLKPEDMIGTAIFEGCPAGPGCVEKNVRVHAVAIPGDDEQGGLGSTEFFLVDPSTTSVAHESSEDEAEQARPSRGRLVEA
jgi:hypothetical protein